MMRTLSRILHGLCLVSCMGCSIFKPAPVWTKENVLVQASFPQTIVIPKPDSKTLSAVEQSISYFRKNAGKTFQFGSDTYAGSALMDSLVNMKKFLQTNPDSSAVTNYLKKNFTLYTSAASDVLFTGYYTPLLRGSITKTQKYRYPVYRRPSDLVSVTLDEKTKAKIPKEAPVLNRGRLDKNAVTIPYYSREEIDTQGKLAGKGLELLWVDDQIDLFFMHIQGSGIIEFENKERWYIGFDDKNGHPYTAIGKTLQEMKLLSKENTTMFTIKDVLRKNPSIVNQVLFSNQSYCFFKKLPKSPVGSIGVPVTAEHTIATDSTLFPHGAPVLFQIEDTHLALNQDTGGAIRGPGRVDIYFGEGTEAERMAAVMQSKGRLFFLAPRK